MGLAIMISALMVFIIQALPLESLPPTLKGILTTLEGEPLTDGHIRVVEIGAAFKIVQVRSGLWEVRERTGELRENPEHRETHWAHGVQKIDLAKYDFNRVSSHWSRFYEIDLGDTSEFEFQLNQIAPQKEGPLNFLIQPNDHFRRGRSVFDFGPPNVRAGEPLTKAGLVWTAGLWSLLPGLLTSLPTNFLLNYLQGGRYSTAAPIIFFSAYLSIVATGSLFPLVYLRYNPAEQNKFRLRSDGRINDDTLSLSIMSLGVGSVIGNAVGFCTWAVLRLIGY